LKIILTGGGTAGHVTPNIALLPTLAKLGYSVEYIGSHNGIENGLINLCGIPYHSISSGKLRRYFDMKNFTDVFRIIKGLCDSLLLLRKIKPNVIFSKGGFVAVPVAIAAAMLKIPIVIHESDITPGLATRIALPFAKVMCASFPETIRNNNKGVLTGSPIRQELLNGDKSAAMNLCGFNNLPKKPIILVIGGSLGAVAINKHIFELLPKLLQDFHIIHICGKGNALQDAQAGYAPFEYLQDELPAVFAAADLIISRAGANTLFELLALKKPHLLIPLTKAASRGDQLLNAASFEKQGFSMVLHEEELSADTLYNALAALYHNQDDYIAKMQAHQTADGITKIVEEIKRWTKK